MSTVKIFAEDVVEKIHRYLPGGYDSVQCEVKEVLKNNGIRMTGIEFQREGSSISQIIYLEPFFEDIRQGKETETVLKNIADSYIQNVSTEYMAVINEQQLIDFESVRQSIEPVLVHTAENREMLGQMPHRKIADLSVYYRIVFQDQGNDMQASMSITNGHMKQWRISEPELYHQAVANMENRGNEYADTDGRYACVHVYRKRGGKKPFEGRNCEMCKSAAGRLLCADK